MTEFPLGLPEYEEDGQEVLSSMNIWRSIESQTVEGLDCFTPNAPLNNDENLVVLKLTATEFLEMYSALYFGAEFAYPDRFMQIIVNFLKGIHCPPLLSEQECFEYPTYASFIQYAPMNPYIDPDEVPDGYETQPFLVNGENGNDIPNYEHFDIFVPIDSITLDVNWLDDIAGQLPTITVMVNGAGKAFIKMLTAPLGGLAVITLDNPPNIADIVTGIVTGAENIIDLNQDFISLPPETAQELIFEVDVVGTGMHTIYIVFLPIIDDSLIPIRFGGGFRGVQLCNFVEAVDMGITNIRFNEASCNLEVLESGTWNIVDGWENWLDCVPSGGSGTGLAAITTTVHKQAVGAATRTNNTTTFQSASGGGAWSHTFTKKHALIQCAILASTNATVKAEFATNVAGANLANRGNAYGSAEKTVVWSDILNSDGLGTVNIDCMFRISSGSSTVTVYDRLEIQWWIIEYDEAEDLGFVEDVRILDNELQKKIGGVWVTVSESLADILSSIQTTANNALAAANSAIATNTAQASQIAAIVTVNNTQNTRLDALEAQDDVFEAEIAALDLIVTDHETRISSLETSQASQDAEISDLQAQTDDIQEFVDNVQFWWENFNFASSASGWSVVSGGSYVAGQGFGSSSGAITIEMPSVAINDGKITDIAVRIFRVSGGAEDAEIIFGNGDPAHIAIPPTSSSSATWYQVVNSPTAYNPTLTIQFVSTGLFYISAMDIIGHGTNPF